MIFQWEMLFPDALDVSVMTTLLISLRRLLMGRITAVAMFLALVHAGTSGLGCLFLPAVADQRCGFIRQFVAQVTAVSMAGICIVAALVALQALLLWMPRVRVAEIVRDLIKASVLIVLMTVLFIFPLTAHSLEQLVTGGTGVVRWLPTFWFLGVYDSIMWGDRVPLVFRTLAVTAGRVTLVFLMLAAITYPLGYLRRVKLLVEGSPSSRYRQGLPYGRRCTGLSSRLRRCDPPHTLPSKRIERLHLYLAMYVGVGTALVLSSVCALRIEGSRTWVVFQFEALRVTVPLVAFWAVAGLRTSLHSPVGKRGSWIYQAISGAPGKEELSGGRRLTLCVSLAITFGTSLLLDVYAPHGGFGLRDVVIQMLLGAGFR